MIFNIPMDFMKFVLSHEQELKSKSPTISTLLLKRELALVCCKCVKREKVQEFHSFYMSLGEKLSIEEKSLLKQLAGDTLVLMDGAKIFLEIS